MKKKELNQNYINFIPIVADTIKHFGLSEQVFWALYTIITMLFNTNKEKSSKETLNRLITIQCATDLEIDKEVFESVSDYINKNFNIPTTKVFLKMKNMVDSLNQNN